MEMPPTKKQRVLLPASKEDFRDSGGRIMNRDPEGRSEAVFERRWMSFFGVCVETIVAVWNLLQVTVGDTDFEGAKPHHLLWALLFLKKYGDETEMAGLVGCDGVAVDEGTFRKWSHLFVERVSYLLCDVIIWENRKVGDVGNDCLVSVDGTDCKIQRQNAAPKAWNSHKFRGPGVRYEVAVCILTGEIVWVIGPFPCGDWPDIVIFRYALKQLLDDNERVEADDGYVGEDPVHIKVPGSMVHDQDPKRLTMRSNVRHRHETVNKRLKQFKCLETVFRHGVELHGMCFRACAILTQLEIKNNSPLWQVEYGDDISL